MSQCSAREPHDPHYFRVSWEGPEHPGETRSDWAYCEGRTAPAPPGRWGVDKVEPAPVSVEPPVVAESFPDPTLTHALARIMALEDEILEHRRLIKALIESHGL